MVLLLLLLGIYDQEPCLTTSNAADLPPGLDPAEMLVHDGCRAFEEAVAKARPIEHHLIDRILEAHDLNEPESVARAIHAARRVVIGISHAHARTAAIAHLAHSVNRDETTIAAYLKEHGHSEQRQRVMSQGRGVA